MIKIRKAVSIIFIHKEEIFFIKRQNFLNAFPGYTAFPGGKVDECDEEGTLSDTLMNTLRRETKEELGIDIVNEKKIDSINKIAKATSPSFNPLRFETYFFAIKISEKINFNVDENEAMEYGWIKPEKILDEFDQGKRLMVGPVRDVYSKLIKNIDDKTFIDLDSGCEHPMPQVEFIKDLIQVMPLSNTIFPATRTNSFIIGDNQKVLIDPSPKNLEELNTYIQTLREYKIEKILITHHHKDHHQYATNIAKLFKIPIYISRDSQQRIEVIYGIDYFKNIKLYNLQEGDIIAQWLGEDIRIYEIPGHDEGHLGIAPTSLKWFLVGDLFQGIGTVVVGGDEGNMDKYMNSLQKIIDLNPKCVIPSHGIALGGVNILKKTYDHRVMREKQILELHNSGKNIEEILTKLYSSIPRSVIKYARQNIESHLIKLKKEKRI